MRLRDSWLLVQKTLWLASTGVLAVLLIGRFVPIPSLVWWAWSLPFLFWLCAVLIVSLFQHRSLMRLARDVDLELGLKERLSTSLEIETSSVTHTDNGLIQYQQADALSISKTIDPSAAFPLKWLRRPTLIAAGMLVAAFALTYLPNPMDAVIAERTAVEAVAQEQAQRIDELKEEIEQTTDLSPEMQAELLRQLEELAQQLRENPGDREKALADLSKLEESLRRQIDPNYDQRQASLEAITSQLQSLAQRENANPPTPAEALEQLAADLENLSETERQELAEALAQMAAQAAQSGDSSLAQALASMSQAAQAGDSEAATQAASEASDAIAQAQSDLTAQAALQQTLNQLQNSSQAFAQAGQQGQQVAGQTPGQGNNPGQSNNPGQGTNPGQGQSGQGMSGGGTRADSLPPGSGSGQARRPNQQDTGGATAELGEQLFVPWNRRPEEGAEVSISGQDTGQGETITRENPNPSGGLPGAALIPYQQVFTQYFEAAQQAIERNDIPPAYRDLVRDYFTQLEP